MKKNFDKSKFTLVLNVIMLVSCAALTVIALAYRFANPELTDTQLFLDTFNWSTWYGATVSGLTVVAVICAILLIFL